MCEFCHQHGEGKKWYLNVSNYSEELFTEAARASARDVLSNLAAERAPMREPPPAWDKVVGMAPALAQRIARRHQKDVHWGQVVPLEDALDVVALTDWIVRLPCVCRSHSVGDRNARYCYGVGIGPTEEPWRSFFTGFLDPTLSVETLTKEQAAAAITELDKKGAMHSVWTFKSPFIGGLCNCDRDCMAWRAQIRHQYQVMFRSEYVAIADADRCNGCRRCMRQCLFGAVQHSLTQGKCVIDAKACYGCGVCRAVCTQDAISLTPRAEAPAAATLWGI